LEGRAKITNRLLNKWLEDENKDKNVKNLNAILIDHADVETIGNIIKLN
jgi:hypothetical protein